MFSKKYIELFLKIIIVIIFLCINIVSIDTPNFTINFLIIILEYSIIYFCYIKHSKKRYNVILMSISLLCSFFQIIGYNCSKYDASKLNVIETYINIFKLIPLMYQLSNLFFDIKFNLSSKNNKLIDFLFNKKYSIFILTIIIFLAWLPILIGLYPGNFSYDAGTQLRMLKFNLITKYHPVIHTIFLYTTIVLGNKIFSSYDIGILIHSIIQMLIMSFSFSYTLIYLYKNKFSNKINIIFLILYMFLPIYGIFSITTTKDVIFSGLFNIALINLIELTKRTDNILNNKKNYIKFIIVFVLLLSFRNNMLYALILFIPFILIILKENKKKILVLFINIILVFFTYDLSLTYIFHIQSGPKIEAFSFVTQQLARVYNVENIDDKYKSQIEKLYNNDSLKKYNSHISDPVKSEFNTTEFLNNKSKYIKLYIDLGLKYPMVYIDSIINNNYSFFYLFDKLPDLNSKTYIEINCLSLSNNTFNKSENCSKNVKFIYDFYYNLVNNAYYQKIPILNIFMSMQFYLMILFLVVSYIIYKRKIKLLVPLMLLVCYVLTNLIAPVAIVRYMFPVFTCMPLIVYLFYCAKTKDDF